MSKAGDLLSGPKVLLMGDSGNGKTTALLTLIQAGITPFVLATEQNFIQVFRPVLGTKAHYKFVAPAPDSSWNKMQDMLKKINDLSYENLCKVSDPFKMQHNKFIDLVTTCNNFKCDCCDKSWGDVATWNTDRALCLDSLSGASDMAFALVIGNKPVRAMPDYQIAQNAIRMFLAPLTGSIKCTFVLCAHLAREKDEITGGTTIAANTVGNKLGPDLPRLFSDVIRARRQGNKFHWDTLDSQSLVVARHVPLADNIEANFKPLIEKWVSLGGQILPTEVK